MRSEQLIMVFYRLGQCSSYEIMERMDTPLTQRITAQAENHRVLVSSDVTSSKIMHGVMDN